MHEGDRVQDVYLLSAPAYRLAKTGKSYWAFALKDVSGSIDAKIWSPTAQKYADIPNGILVEVLGDVRSFNGEGQVVVSAIRQLDENEVAALDLAQWLPGSRRPPEEMFAELQELCKKELVHKPWRKFVLGVLSDKDIHDRFLKAPAATGIHHAWVGGLLEHTLSVAALCMRLCDQYPLLDRQILLAAAVCHDLGKLWELSPLGTSYTDEGQMLGHIMIGLEKLARPLEKSGLAPEHILHFKHLILSHHGKLEFGSPKLPLTPEALALSFADDLDAKLTLCAGLFKDFPEEGTGWSQKNWALGRAMYHALRTPAPEQADSPKEKAGSKPVTKVVKDDQCSLL